MVRYKIFGCSTENLDEVVQEVAKEIEAGYHIARLELLDLTISARTRPEPSFQVYMERRG